MKRLTLATALILTLIAANPFAAIAADENVTFACKGSAEAVAAAEAKESVGFFGRIFRFLFSKDAPTVVVIECPNGELPGPAPAVDAPAADSGGGIFNAIAGFLRPRSATIATSTPRSSGIKPAPPKTAPPAPPAPAPSTPPTSQLPPEEEPGPVDEGSAYKNWVRVYFQRSADGNPNNERFTITVLGNAPKDLRVPITSFHLSTEYGESFAITGATPFIIPGKVTERSPIALKPGEKAIISTGSSPNGYSFRLNTCTGFFNQGQRFNPALPRGCPYPASEKWTYGLTPQCMEYVGKIGRCVTPYQLPLGLDSECQNAVAEHVNYNGCIEAHKGDPDFFKNEWRIYLDRSKAIYRAKYDTVTLLDERGKVVWSYLY